MNAFVAGGSRGIGRAIVLRFVEQGYSCAFTYSNRFDAANETIELARKINPKIQVKSYKMDQACSDQVESVVDEAVDVFEDFDILVNNAAINRNNALALMSDEEWDDVIKTNLYGPFYLIRKFLMAMIGRRYGRIINISSLAQGGSSGQAGYAVSKGGLVTLTQSVAREYGAKGITCNVVTVGYVPTDLTETHLAEKLAEIWMEYCPMKRVGTAEEIADMVNYLTSPNAGFINGEIISISGGLTYVP